MTHPNLLATCSLDTSETCKKNVAWSLVAARWKFCDAASPKTNINSFLGKHSFDSFYNKIMDQPNNQNFPKEFKKLDVFTFLFQTGPRKLWGKKIWSILLDQNITSDICCFIVGTVVSRLVPNRTLWCWFSWHFAQLRAWILVGNPTNRLPPLKALKAKTRSTDPAVPNWAKLWCYKLCPLYMLYEYVLGCFPYQWQPKVLIGISY